MRKSKATAETVALLGRLIRAIREDNQSGAVMLTLKAGEGLLSYAQTLRNAPLEEAGRAITELAVQLALAQPAMAALFNLANAVLFAADGIDYTKGLARVEKTVTEFCASLKRSTELVAERAAQLIYNNAVIITNSASDTVFECLKQAQKLGKRFRVICPESRPMREGVELARRLGALKIPVTLIADALAPWLVSEADVVLVGGDALSREGLINKIGTYGLALAAREAAVKFIALMGTQKFMPQFDLAFACERSPAELLSEPLKSVRVCNRYFDLTPLRLISRLITEEGELNQAQIHQKLAELNVHERLKRAFVS